MAPKSNPIHLRSIIQTVIGELDKKQVCSEEEIRSAWLGAVGEAAARHAQPTSLKKGVLYAVVDNPGWMQELAIKKRGILKALHRHFTKDDVRDIKFWTGVLRK